MSYYLESARGFLPIPIIVTEPAVGYGGGGVAMFVRPRKEAGDEGWARPDISGVGSIVTQNETWAAFAGDVTQWLDGRLKSILGGGTGRVNLDFYGLGENRPSFDQPVRYSLDFTGAVAQGNWKMRRRRRGRSVCATSTRTSNRSCETTRCFRVSLIEC